ncbi:MAG TPA: tetratricopeptide repeat protein [Blastocatellia bacterium]|nr:tetratricopeptide repeat protein [Blastocatellia bacterium]
MTRRIGKDPKNAALYLKRGELHRLHRDWGAALADYDRAERLDPRLAIVQFSRGRMFFEADKPQQAKLWLDRFLTGQPDHLEALVTRARVLVKLGQRLAAAQDYSRAIAQLSRPRPELYLERAQALAAAGGPHRDEALRGLDEGIQTLGPLVTLELLAIELEVDGGRYDAALARVEQIAAQSPRKERWLARRAEILRQAGRTAEARQAFTAALAAIESLPAHRRKNKATAELEKRARAALQQ